MSSTPMIYSYTDSRGATWQTVMEPVATDVSYWWHNEDRNTNIYEWSVRPCAGGGEGCPAVMKINDTPDTVFTEQWQYYLVAINQGMSLNNIAHLMGTSKALMNNTGIGNNRRNFITGEDLDASEDPRLDKLRTFARNTHQAIREGERWRLVTMDGTKPPPLKPGCVYPERLEDVNIDIYVHTPQTHPHLFLVCNNVQTKPGGVTSVFPFANGVKRDWLDDEIYTFFPFVSVRPQYVDPDNWTQLEPGETRHPYRRVS